MPTLQELGVIIERKSVHGDTSSIVFSEEGAEHFRKAIDDEEIVPGLPVEIQPTVLQEGDKEHAVLIKFPGVIPYKETVSPTADNYFARHQKLGEIPSIKPESVPVAG